MADLTIQQVGTNSWINHPDFKDVCNTPYAKGVISDFEVISTDPFTVSSNVKVTGEWGESGYIPLLYNQKPGYWDTAGGNEKAWMSFRCGDEVKVLLSEGVPKAVVGFYDGVPRVGETIFKMDVGDKSALWKMITGEKYESDVGPDGLNLGLQIVDEVYQTKEKQDYYHDYCVADLPGDYHYILAKNDNGDCQWVRYKGVMHIHMEEYSYIQWYLLIIGPILYLVGKWHGRGSYSSAWALILDDGNITEEDIADCNVNFNDTVLYDITLEYHYEEGVGVIACQNLGPFPGEELESNWYWGTPEVYAALYNEELLNTLKSNPELVYSDKTIFQSIITDNIVTFYDGFNSDFDDTWNLAKLYKSPHTKEEL